MPAISVIMRLVELVGETFEGKVAFELVDILVKDFNELLDVQFITSQVFTE